MHGAVNSIVSLVGQIRLGRYLRSVIFTATLDIEILIYSSVSHLGIKELLLPVQEPKRWSENCTCGGWLAKTCTKKDVKLHASLVDGINTIVSSGVACRLK